MSGTEGGGTIADASKPNAGRIYDYLLGGDHNFEIDRQAAEQLKAMVPEMPQWVRIVRWFLGEAVGRLLDEGFRHFLDFASGLPTVDHIHQIAPQETKVIYSDIDPVTVAYAQKIVKDLPNVRYFQCDAAQPEAILDSDHLEQLLGETRRVAIGFNGIAWFLPDDAVAHATKILYDWAAPGSRLYYCDINLQVTSEANVQMEAFYKRVGQPIYARSRATVEELIGEWRVDSQGFLPLEQWVGLSNDSMEDATVRAGGNLIGAILTK